MERVVGPPGDPQIEEHSIGEREYTIVRDRGTVGPLGDFNISGLPLTVKIMRHLPKAREVAKEAFERLPLANVEMDTPHFIPLQFCVEVPERMHNRDIFMYSLAIILATAVVRKWWDAVDMMDELVDLDTTDPVSYTINFIGCIVGIAHRGIGLPFGPMEMHALRLDGGGPEDGPAWDPKLMEFTHTLR
mgnify:CR=1 FL=1